MEEINRKPTVPAPWNKGQIVGQKTPFKLKETLGYSSTSATRRSPS